MSLSGRVKKWDPARGTGFVCSNEGVDVYVTRESFTGTDLLVGMEVTYDVITRTVKPEQLAVNVTGDGVCVEGSAAEAKIALRDAMSRVGQFDGHVANWNDLLGSGTIEDSRGHTYVVHRGNVQGSGSLVRGLAVNFDVREKKAVNVSGAAVVPEGDLPDEDTIAQGKKKGVVLKWSSATGEGVVSFPRGPKDVNVRSKAFSLVPGAEITYEIVVEPDGSYTATNCSGVGVSTATAPKQASSRLRSMKFMQRKQEAVDRQQQQENALKEKAEQDLEATKQLRKAGLDSNIRVVVSDDFPIQYHALGRRRFGDIAVAKVAPQEASALDLKPVAPSKNNSRYHSKDDGPTRKTNEQQQQETFGGHFDKRAAKRKHSDADGPRPTKGKQRKRPKPAAKT